MHYPPEAGVEVEAEEDVDVEVDVAHSTEQAEQAAHAEQAQQDAPASCCPSALTVPLAPDAADELARGFHALGDPIRLRVLSMLAAAPAGEICVCDFIGPLGRTQGTVSHHLRILAEAGLVHGDRRGRWVWYSLDRDRLAALTGAGAGAMSITTPPAATPP